MFSAFFAKATHIVGGELIYEHLGGSSYYLTLKLFKDCNPGTANFPNDVEIEAFSGFGLDTIGVSSPVIVLPRLGRDTLDPEVDTCAFNPGVCVEEAIFGGIVSLPPVAGGYHLFYQTFARNASLLNVVSPLTTGESFYAYIPDNAIYLTNSSPVFSNSPPVFVCRDQDLNLDFSATDADGDSLVYSFYQPYNGRPFFHPLHFDPVLFYPTIDLAGTPPDNITFPTATYSAGFSADNPLNSISGTPLTISSTGVINGAPEAVGQYVVGVMVEEYRDGVKIGEIVRDFQFNVLNCPPPQNADIGALDGCSGLAIDFINNSGDGATGFFWDFGTGDPGDTSIVEEPTFDFTPFGFGTYEITLIAQKGTNCADTATFSLTISGVVADFAIPDTVCTFEPINFMDNSTSEINGVIDTWEWDFGDGTTSSLEDPTHDYSTAGDYTVRLIVSSNVGCSDTLEQMIHVREHPGAGIMPMMGCIGLDVTFTNTSASDAEGFHWDFGTGFPADTSDLFEPSFTFPDFGMYTITLITQPNTFCADTVMYDILISNAVADFIAPDTTCTNVLIDFEDISTVENGEIFSWEWDFGDGSFSTESDPSHGYTSEGDFTVTLIVISTIGCADTISKTIHIEDAPQALIGPTDFCSGLTIDFINASEPGATGFFWDFGTGFIADTSILENPTFTYDSFGGYTVTLITQKGTVCETSIDVDIIISDLTAAISAPDTTCVGSEIDFMDFSVTVSGTTITEWDWNFGDLFTSDLQNPNHLYSDAGDYTIEFVVTSDVGCTDTLFHDINVQVLPIANAGLDTAVCLSDPSLMLDGIIENATSGIWSSTGAGTFSPSETDLDATYFPSLDELIAGSTQLILTTVGNGFCEAQMDTITVNYLGDPEVNAGPDINVCDDATSVDLLATIGFGTNIVWTTEGDGTFDDDESLSTTYDFGPLDIASGEITIFINTFNFSGCMDDADTVVIFLNEPPTIDMFNDTIICSGFPLLLESNSSTENANWGTSGDGIFDPVMGETTTYMHGPMDLADGTFEIYIESADNGGCPAVFDTLSVTVIPSPTPAFTVTEVCFGLPTEFENMSTSVDPIDEFLWIFESSETSTDENPSHTFTFPGVHNVQLILTSENGCMDTLTQEVLSHFIPEPNFDVPTPCLNGGTQFIDSTFVGNSMAVSWNWDFGDGSPNDTTQNPIHQYNAPGTYEITLSVTSEFGCSNDTIIPLIINLGPTADFSVNPASTNPFVDITFTDESTEDGVPIISWDWDFDDGDSSNTQNTSHQYDTEGEYNVQLVIADELGCSDTAIQIVPIFHGPLVPSAFSPNGDSNNDFLFVVGGNFSAVDFTVYNNWGQIVFESSEVNIPGWDGTFKGEPQPLGVYVYVAKVTTFDGVEQILSGDVSLIR